MLPMSAFKESKNSQKSHSASSPVAVPAASSPDSVKKRRGPNVKLYPKCRFPREFVDDILNSGTVKIKIDDV
jgi:hypothetical protein